MRTFKDFFLDYDLRLRQFSVVCLAVCVWVGHEHENRVCIYYTKELREGKE